MDGIVNQSMNVYAVFRDYSGSPVSGLSDVTVTIYDPSNNADVSAGACTEIGTTGRYYKAFTPDQKGSFLANFSTASASVQIKNISASFYIADTADLKADVSALATAANLAIVDGVVDTILTRTDVATSTRLASASYSAPPSAAAISDQVWDETYGSHMNAGTFGLFLYDLISRLTSARAGYLDKLNVSGTIAHSDAAATYKADVSALATSAELHEIKNISGTSGYDRTTDSLEALRNRVDEVLVATGTPTGYAPTTAVRTAGSDQGGTYTALASHDETLFSTGEDASTGLDVTVTRETSTVTENPSLIRVNGYYAGGPGHFIDVQVWNYTASAWESKGQMASRNAAFEYLFPLSSWNHDGSTGEMKIRFLHNVTTYFSSHRLYLDFISFEKVNSNSQIASDLASIAAQTAQLNFSAGKVLARNENGLIITTPGDAMALTSVYDAAKTAASQASVDTVDGIVDNILLDTNELQINQGNWLTATGFATAAALTAIDGKIDIIDSNIDLVLSDTSELQTNQGNWLTATGFAVPGDLAILEGKIDTIDGNIDLVLVDTANLMSTVEPYGDGYIFTEIALQNAPVTTPSADVNVISVNGVSVTSVNDFKATGFSTFDPAVDLVKIGTNYDKTGYALANPDLCKADLTTAEANLATLLARLSATRAGYFDYIDDNYANINTLLTRLTDTRAAKLDNVSQFDAETDVVYANIDLSDLELDLNIGLIHEAFNTYPDSLPPGVNPPVVLPPDNTDAVKIYAYCFAKDSNTILTDCNGTLELLLSTEENGKHHKADPESGTYYDDTGELFWLVPPYAKVRVQIPALKIDVIGYTGAGAETLRVDRLYKAPQVPA